MDFEDLGIDDQRALLTAVAAASIEGRMTGLVVLSSTLPEKKPSTPRTDTKQ